MTYKEIIDEAKPEFDKAFRFFEGEVAKIRTSRASPALVEDIEVNAFGQKFPLKQLGSISAPATNQLVIQPWDASYIEPIQNAISQSGLGMSMAVDKNLIRLNLPLLTEEYRTQLSKLLGEKAEQAKQTIRHAREDCWNKIQTAQKDKLISEDDKFRGKDELQKVVDDHQEKIKNLVEKKKNEIV
ncbi:MAG: ribosome recycling factor [Candidatus Staskawiczbacteria bacterium RIFOXYD1_FULL_39_28]|uniref:Ribosome recycling factor n=1 Tax=Candidatus Staskawiczbacteria bacterium RIFOXYC1_FULL_38_18 TaxID=1802229 RepID=A0A1G2JEV5_9BACT|nr:MAG: ribosome recycling factor [Candidatus Staskawiczbacteria bacterium RIFOXYC1_FULL_38_18]OGZ92508.1 MAG: ribosome recycling factor [Candidatus Staskawiczbacteria bacterium RIFOXYD1_FULL_39_28]